MKRFWSLAVVALLLTALPLRAADTSKLLADASAKAPMLAFLTYTIDNDPPQPAGGQALCIDANKGIFMTYAVESWMKKKSIKDASLLLSDGKTSVTAELLWVDPESGLGFFKATGKGTFVAATFQRDAKFELTIFDASGRRVRTLEAGTRAPGEYRARWDLSDEVGRPVRAGLYFARLEVEGRRIVRRLAVAR